jgi:hypothetical protein
MFLLLLSLLLLNYFIYKMYYYSIILFIKLLLVNCYLLVKNYTLFFQKYDGFEINYRVNKQTYPLHCFLNTT